MPLLILDFDGTITRSDTINALAQSVIAKHHTISPPAWDNIVNAWLDDYSHHTETHKPADNTNLTQTLTFLESLRHIEMASLARVEAAGLFRGVENQDLHALGVAAAAAGESGESKSKDVASVRLRPGFTKLINHVRYLGWDVAIVSVNWSRDWVEGILGKDVAKEVVFMKVNRAGGNQQGRVVGPEGDPEGVLVTAGDKLRAVREVLQQQPKREREREHGKGEGSSSSRWVYVGDSTTDLACLVEAHVGIVIADHDGGSLLGALRRFGREVPHVTRAAERHMMWWASDFDEILESGVLDVVAGRE